MPVLLKSSFTSDSDTPMNKFLRNIFIFSSIIIVILGVLELVARSLPTSYSYKNDWIESDGDKVRNLVLGSSHTYYGLRPDVMGDSTFNLANVSQTPEYDLALLEHYLPLMPNIKRVIIPVSYFTFRDPKIEQGDEWNLAVRYKIHMGLPLHSVFSIYNLEITDFDAYKGKLKNLILKAPSNICDSLGFGLGFTLATRDDRWKEISRARAAKHTVSTPGRFDEVREVHDRLARLAKQHNIDVVVITTPSWPAYTAALDSVQLAEMYEGIGEMLKNEKVTYYDFLNDARFEDSDYYDPDHLNDLGAAKLTQILADTLSNTSISARK